MNNTINIFVGFDGTGNHKDNDVAIMDGSQSNVARLFDLYDSPYKLYETGVGTVKLTDEQIALVYEGKAKKEDSYESLDMALGKEVKDKVNLMVEKLHKVRKEALNNIPENGNISIDIAGFSRGATSARDFVNEVNKIYAQEIKDGKIVLNNVILFDTVASVGLANDTNYGLNLNLGANSAKNILHLTANDEKRDNFPLESLKDKNGNTPENIKEIVLYGVHSDIGAGYANKVEEYTVVKSAYYNPSKKEDLVKEAEVLGYDIKFSEHQVRYKGDVYTYHKYTFVETEVITNELSNVSLKLAHDELLNNGSPLKEIPLDKQITTELQEYYNSIKNQETDLSRYKDIVQKYIHDSSYDATEYFSEQKDRFVNWLGNKDSNERVIYTNEEENSVRPLVPSTYNNEDGVKELFHYFVRTQNTIKIEGSLYIYESAKEAIEDTKEFIIDKFNIKDETSLDIPAIEQSLINHQINNQGISDLEELAIDLVKEVETNKEEKVETVQKEFLHIDSQMTIEQRVQSLKEYEISSTLDNYFAKQLINQYQDKVIENQGQKVSNQDFINMDIKDSPKEKIQEVNKNEEKEYLSFSLTVNLNQNATSSVQMQQ